MDAYKIFLPLDKTIDIEADDFKYQADKNYLYFSKGDAVVAIFNTNSIVGFIKVN